MRRAARTLLALLLAFVAAALLGRFVVHGPVDGRSLARSVEAASGSAGSASFAPGACRRQRLPGRWACEVVDPSGSGPMGYAVRVRPGSSCWSARLAFGGGEQSEVDGCVRRWQWTLTDLLL